MENPLKPVAQMAQYDRRAQAEADQQDFTQKRLLAQAANTVQQQQQPQLLTRENSGGMGWKARLAMNQQILSNYQDNINNQRNNTTLTSNAREGNANDVLTTQMSGQNQIEQAKISGQNQLATQGLQNQGSMATTQANLTAEAPTRSAQEALTREQAAGSQLDNEQRQRLASLEKAYTQETDPEKRKVIEDSMRALSGKDRPKYERATVKDVSENGMVQTEKTYAYDPSNPHRQIEIGGEQAQPPPPPAPEDLKIGQVYDTPKGKMKWNGQKFVAVK